MRKEGEANLDYEPVNEAKALWTRSPRRTSRTRNTSSSISTSPTTTPSRSAWSHNKVEGKREYTSLLYIPGRAPFDLWQRDAARGLKLYVRRVFIMDDAEQFLPQYLRFVKGIVDSSDLPLNVSRELLQQDPEVDAIRSGLTKRVLDMLAKLAKDEPEKYATFWKEFGAVLKEGLAQDFANRDKILPLLRFASTHESGERADDEPCAVRRAHEARPGDASTSSSPRASTPRVPAPTSSSSRSAGSKCCCWRSASTSG